MSILFSPFIQLSPSPLCPQAHSLYLHLHSFLANRFINTIFLDLTYIYSNIWFFFSFLSTSFYITILGSSTSLKLTEIHSFLWLSSISLYICNTSFNGHLGFHVLAIVNIVAMNTEVHVSVSIMVFSGYMHSSRNSISYVVLFLVF